MDENEPKIPVAFEEKLHSVHDSLREASQEDKDEGDSTVASFRIGRQVKEAADVICKSNATTLSGFLRKCVEGLVRDYCPGQTQASGEDGSPSETT